MKPAVEFLTNKEKQDPDNPRDVIQVLDSILKQLDTSDTEEEVEASGNVYMSQSEVKNKVWQFKKDLVTATSSEEFMQMMEPIIKFRQAQGYQYSFKNSILIWVQDPNATMVKSAKDWERMNREVIPGAVAIGLFIPKGGQRAYKGKAERESVKARFLQQHNAESEEDLTPGEQEKLRHLLASNDTPTSFSLGFYFYDIKSTRQIEGKEEIVSDKNSSDVDWFNDKGNETMAVKEKIEAILEVIRDAGIQTQTTRELGGALGVSKGGHIEFLDTAKMNSNFLNTLAHEFAHEILHQNYLKDNNPEFSSYYIGRGTGAKGPIEQQAEITAWAVCKFYGYDIKESINYVGIWGGDTKNAVKAFDMVANAINLIINKMNAKIQAKRQQLSESIHRNNKDMLQEINLTGLDVAKMIGAEDVYRQSEQENEELKESVKNDFFSLLNRMDEAEKGRKIDMYD